MKYSKTDTFKTADNVLFTQVLEDQVNIFFNTEDNFIYKLNKLAADSFILFTKGERIEEVVNSLVKKTSKDTIVIENFIDELIDELLKQKFIIKK